MPFSQLTHSCCNVGDDMAMGPLSGHLRLHEAKDITFLWALERDDPNPLSPDNDAISATNVSHRNSMGRGAFLIDHDRKIHLDSIDVKPATSYSDLSGQMGGGIEGIGKDPIVRHWFSPTVCPTLDRGAMGLNRVEDLV